MRVGFISRNLAPSFHWYVSDVCVCVCVRVCVCVCVAKTFSKYTVTVTVTHTHGVSSVTVTVTVTVTTERRLTYHDPDVFSGPRVSQLLLAKVYVTQSSNSTGFLTTIQVVTL